GTPTLAEVPGMVVGEAKDIETGVGEMLDVAGRRTKQKTCRRVGADLAWSPAVDQHTLEVAEGQVRCRQDRRHAGEKSGAVVIRQMILRVIGSEHHVADGGDRQFAGYGGCRRLGLWCLLRRPAFRRV